MCTILLVVAMFAWCATASTQSSCETVSINDISPSELYQRYLIGSRPVVIKDAAPTSLRNAANWTSQNLLDLWGENTRVLVSYAPDRWFVRPEMNQNGELVMREAAFLNTTLGQYTRLVKTGCCWAVNQLEIGDARSFYPLPEFAEKYMIYDRAQIWINQDRKKTTWHADSFHAIFSQIVGSKTVTLVQGTPENTRVLHPQRLPVEQLFLPPAVEKKVLSINVSSADHPKHQYMRQRCPCRGKRGFIAGWATVNAFGPCQTSKKTDADIYGGEQFLCQDNSFMETLPNVQCSLNAGELLLVPAGWWHDVESRAENSLSVMVTQWFFPSKEMAERLTMLRTTKGKYAYKVRAAAKVDPYSAFNFDFLSKPHKTCDKVEMP